MRDVGAHDERLDPMSAPPELPEIVSRAFDVSRRAGYVSFCRNETGRLLATLAATRDGTMAEFGTGCGVGTAWLRSGVRDGRADPHRRAGPRSWPSAAAEIFEDDPQVEVLAADWSTLRDKGPFSLLFLDSGEPDERPRRRHRRPASSTAASWCSTTSRRASCWPPIYPGPRRHAARGVADRRPVHHGRGDGRPDASTLIATRR